MSQLTSLEMVALLSLLDSPTLDEDARSGLRKLVYPQLQPRARYLTGAIELDQGMKPKSRMW